MLQATKIKYLTKGHIQQFNERDVVVSTATICSMSEDTHFPVQTYYEDGESIRAKVVLNEEGDTVMFSINQDEWNALPHQVLDKPAA